MEEFGASALPEYCFSRFDTGERRIGGRIMEGKLRQLILAAAAWFAAVTATPAPAHAQAPVGYNAFSLEQKLLCWSALGDRPGGLAGDYLSAWTAMQPRELTEEQWAVVEQNYNAMVGGDPAKINTIIRQCMIEGDVGLPKAAALGVGDAAACMEMGPKAHDPFTPGVKYLAQYGRLEFETRALLYKQEGWKAAKDEFLALIHEQAKDVPLPAEQNITMSVCASAGPGSHMDEALFADLPTGVRDREDLRDLWGAWRSNDTYRTLAICDVAVKGDKWTAHLLATSSGGFVSPMIKMRRDLAVSTKDLDKLMEALAEDLLAARRRMPGEALERIKKNCAGYGAIEP